MSDSPSPVRASAQEQHWQQTVNPWLQECFGPEIAADRIERNHRFIEEALELVQSLGCTQSEAHQLVDYVFTRTLGEPAQEAGGVMVTLAALCLANGLDMHDCGEVELARCWAKIDKIRAKQAAKPKHSPLPAAEARGRQQAEQELQHWRSAAENFGHTDAHSWSLSTDESRDYLTRALKDYGQHKRNCAKWAPYPRILLTETLCTCGYDAASPERRHE